jgi:Na+/proline symporter
MAIAILIANVYRLAIVSWTILLVGLFMPFAFGMYWRAANKSGAIAAFWGGFISWLIGSMYVYPTTSENNMVEGVVEFEDAVWDAVVISSTPAVIVSLVMLVVVSLLTRHRDPPMSLTDVDGRPLPLENRLGVLLPRDLL